MKMSYNDVIGRDAVSQGRLPIVCRREVVWGVWLEADDRKRCVCDRTSFLGRKKFGILLHHILPRNMYHGSCLPLGQLCEQSHFWTRKARLRMTVISS
jgi:hypothetical protein